MSAPGENHLEPSSVRLDIDPHRRVAGVGTPAYIGPLPRRPLWFRVLSWFLGQRFASIDQETGLALEGRVWRGRVLLTGARWGGKP